MNKKLGIILIGMLIACGGKQIPTDELVVENFIHEPINFSFADSIAGIYVGSKITNSGPPNFIISEEQVSITVTDVRTEKECRFYVDLFDENVLVLRNGSFETSWNYIPFDPGNGSIYLTQSEFLSDSLHLEENFLSNQVNYSTFIFHGKRQ